MVNLNSNISDDDYLDELHQEAWLKNLPVFIYIIVIATMGMLGNTLTLFVYAIKKKKSATTVFIEALAIVDLISDVVFIPVILCVLWHGFKVNSVYLCKFFYFLNYSTATTSVVLLVAISYVRFKKVCHSFGHHISTRESKLLCVAIVFACFFLCTPHVIIQGRQTMNTTRSAVKGYMCRVDDKYVDTHWPLVLHVVFTSLFLVCSSCLTYMYARIGIFAWRHGSLYGARIGLSDTQTNDDEASLELHPSPDKTELTRNATLYLQVTPEDSGIDTKTLEQDNAIRLDKSDSNCNVYTVNRKKGKFRIADSVGSRQRHNGRTTRMLLVLTSIYILTNLTSLVLLLLRTIKPKEVANLGTTGVSIYNVFVASYLINTAVNPIIYSVWNRTFRLHCRQLLGLNKSRLS
ncbi:neurotensin receptor type 1-like isoform X3 [Biomphalaria glabrata]|uniref:Neurotensin receptor type 1-like isoform X3 n=1 Tax=Biomphalaria glabrata TaxID=6526 RepID=A0A9W2ZA09_BIOGL|nr:neurotensin receptor type 1-like isoform X3 [Biomphalaria glabrata]